MAEQASERGEGRKEACVHGRAYFGSSAGSGRASSACVRGISAGSVACTGYVSIDAVERGARRYVPRRTMSMPLSSESGGRARTTSARAGPRTVRRIALWETLLGEVIL